MENMIGRWASNRLLASIESSALLALAFCNSHQLAAQDLVRYEKLESWDTSGEEVRLEGTGYSELRQGVTEQARLLRRSKGSHRLGKTPAVKPWTTAESG